MFYSNLAVMIAFTNVIATSISTKKNEMHIARVSDQRFYDFTGNNNLLDVFANFDPTFTFVGVINGAPLHLALYVSLVS
jgi:hypothetical protein